MRGIQPKLRAGSSYIQPDRICGLHRRARAARRVLVLVTSRHFLPPWTIEEIQKKTRRASQTRREKLGVL
jgi:hypothetical protein